MANHSIHGNILEVTVVGCKNLKDIDWRSMLNPCVCVECGCIQNRTSVCKDGANNPTFQDKFIYLLVDGLRELNISVWNINTDSPEELIGSGKVRLDNVLSHGYDDSPWPLKTQADRYAGEVRLIMQYSHVIKSGSSFASSALPYDASSAYYNATYSAPPPAPYMYYPPPAPYMYYRPPTPYMCYPPPAPYMLPPPPAAYMFSPQPAPYMFSAPPAPIIYSPSPYPPQAAPNPSPSHGLDFPYGSSCPEAQPTSS